MEEEFFSESVYSFAWAIISCYRSCSFPNFLFLLFLCHD